MSRAKILVAISVLSIIFCGCGKKTEYKNKKLAQTYYKLCMLELSQSADKNINPQMLYRKALEYIQDALRYDSSAECLAVKATLLFRLGDFEQSRNNFLEALKRESSPKLHASILNNYACLSAQIGDVDKALSIFNKLEKDNDYFTPQAAVFNKGKIFFEKQDYKQAISEFSRAVRLAPEYIDAHYFLALSALRLKNISLAKKELEAVLFLEPDHREAIMMSDKLGLTK
jgi:tetratricopeptide (TPR) repeat protein